jgi:SAM-dependent methyltransferase
MVRGNWFSSYTTPNRYYLTGITDHVKSYVKETGKKKLVIVDVGCSTGIAIRNMSDELNQDGIQTFTIGIDPSPKLKDDAQSNLDKFVNKDVLRIKPKPVADIVICSKMAIYVSAKRRAKIITKTIEFLKNDGAMITDVDCYERIPFWKDLFEQVGEAIYVMGSFASLRYNRRRFREEFEWRVNLHYRKSMKIYGKINAVDYPRQILEGWNKLNWYQKFDWTLTIRIKRLREKLFPVRPKHK